MFEYATVAALRHLNTVERLTPDAHRNTATYTKKTPGEDFPAVTVSETESQWSIFMGPESSDARFLIECLPEMICYHTLTRGYRSRARTEAILSNSKELEPSGQGDLLHGEVSVWNRQDHGLAAVCRPSATPRTLARGLCWPVRSSALSHEAYLRPFTCQGQYSTRERPGHDQ